MSDTADKRHLKCKFGLINLAGLMPMRNKVDEDGAPLSSEILVPLFSHESYKIKTTFNTNLTFLGNSSEHSFDFAQMWFNYPDVNHKAHYQKKFRRDVLWDFGDGTQVQGYNVEHHYTKPGRYKITCTFFDINRRGWVNDFCLYVTVKEVIPTMLRFDKERTKKSIKCSKIERITRLESLISNNVDKELNVSVKRVFSKEEHDNNYEEIGRHYDEITKSEFFHMEKYWTPLKNVQTLYYNSDQVYASELIPSNTFTPQYNKLYCKFFYDEENKELAPIGLSFYQVIPYKNIDEELKTVKVINPCSKIIDEEIRKTYNITQVYTEEQLPEGVTYCGMRGWVDVFYKNDFTSSINTLSIFHDIENENITGELDSSPNYLNINPLGLSFSVKENDAKDIRIGISGNGFFKPMENGAKLSDSSVFVDQHLRNSLYKGADLNCYIFPYVIYDNEDVKVMDDSYYIPKDVILTKPLRYSRTTDAKYGRESYVDIDKGITRMYPWMYCVPLLLNNYIDITFNVSTNKEKSFIIRLTQKPLQNPKNINIPREKGINIDIDRLLDVYMVHPMFKEKSNLRDLLKTYIGGFVENVLTEGNNFLDNTGNIRTCYLSNLLSTLKMMGQDITEYEYTTLEGINDLKKFSRILSINHSDLVGHVIDVDYDITINKDIKGINVGDLIDLDNKITLVTDIPADNEPNEKDNYGKIQYVQIDDKTHKIKIDGGVDLIVHDKYTNDTKIVNFRQYLKELGKDTVTIGEYEHFWGWNLLLPDGFTTLKEKIDLYQSRIDNLGYSEEQRNFFKTEINRLRNTRKELIRSYYDFYLLNPNKGDLRFGNFLRDEDIIPEIESSKEWEAIWGIAHDILMKIILENGNLMSDRYIDSDDYTGDDVWESVYLNITKSYNKNEIKTLLNGSFYDYDTNEISIWGDVNVRGEILGEGKNILHVTLNDGLIDYSDKFWIDDNELICEVIGNQIFASKTFEILSEISNNIPIVSGTITVTITGTIDNPNVTVTSDIVYMPNNLEVEIDISASFEGEMTNEEITDVTKHYTGNVNAHCIITGAGQNLVELTIPSFRVDDIDETLKIINGNEMVITVNEDGTIVPQEHTFGVKSELSDNNGNLIVTGSITIKISGSVTNPILEVIDSSLTFQKKAPELNDIYNIIDSIKGLNDDFSFTDGDTFIQSSIDGAITKPTFFNIENAFIRRYNNNWELYIKGVIYSELYQPREDFGGWQVKEYVERAFKIEINEYGDITPIDIRIPFVNETTINELNLNISLNGNVHEGTAECYISLSENPRGIYVFLFDVNENYKIGQEYDNVIFDYLDDFTNVKVFFEGKNIPIECKKSYEISSYLYDIKLQITNVEWVDGYTQVDEATGDIIYVDGYEKETVEYDLSSTVSNIKVSVNSLGFIEHEDFIINFQDEYGMVNATLVITGGERQSVKSLSIFKKRPNILDYYWKKTFENKDDICHYSIDMIVSGSITDLDLIQGNVKMLLSYTVKGDLDSYPVYYYETKEVDLNDDGTLKESHTFTCDLTNREYDMDENAEDYKEPEQVQFDLYCVATAKGGHGDNFIVNGNVTVNDEDDSGIFIIYDDNDNVINCKLGSLQNGTSLFNSQKKLTSFGYNLKRVIIGDDMFNDCSKLTTFTSELRSLKSAVGMFKGCILNAASLDSISTHINDISSLDKNNDNDWKFEYDGYSQIINKGNRGRIDITLNKSVSQDVINECGNIMGEKGWKIYYNDELYNPVKQYNYESSKYLRIERIRDGGTRRETIMKSFVSIKGQRNHEQDGQINYNMEVSYSKYDVQPTTLVFDISPNNSPDDGSFGKVTKFFNIDDYEIKVTLHSIGENVEIEFNCDYDIIRIKTSDVPFEDETIASPYDVSEANGWCPNAYKSDTDNWNTNVFQANDLIITTITSNGEMINNE